MRVILAPMQGVLDHLMREVLTSVNDYDLCVSEFIRVVDQLPELRARRQERPRTIDVVGEGRRADDQHVVVTAQLFHDALAHRRQVAGEQRMLVGETAAPGHRRVEHAGLVRFG